MLIPTRNPLVTAKSAEEDEQRYTGANTGEQSDRAKTSTATTFSSERDMLEKRNKELKHDYLEHKTKKNKGYMSEKEVEGGGPAISSQGAGDVVSSSGSIHDNALVGDCRPDFETDHPQVSRQEMMPSNWPLALSEIDQLDTLVEAGSEAFQARAPLADKKNW
ncbi:unnamed protein product [Protopolystoma xenopodis]|uniref:Uncharacterized protein n=1 Tax=Protopolystoma xenopodis TaxID=117903 RepID=A0A3S5A529_9PLAT|nr:unnamed protein product [Protopolystoma xenopodis]